MALTSFSGSGLLRLGLKDSAVISDTPTGNYSSGGVTYDYWEFDSSSSLTVSQAGLADVLVVGGGGGGGRNGGGGGGAGGYLETANAYLTTGTLTVIVGAGGSGAPTTSAPAFPVMVAALEVITASLVAVVVRLH